MNLFQFCLGFFRAANHIECVCNADIHTSFRDVYKRQVLKPAFGSQVTKRIIFSNDTAPSIPVSYTHLDVYKRQFSFLPEKPT